MRTGRIETVWVERYGCHLIADAAVNDTVLPVSSTADLDEDGGQLQEVESGTILDYATIDPEADTVTLTDPLAAALSDGDTLRVYPLTDDLMAHVRLDDAEDDEEPLTARVVHSLRTVIAEGVREDEKESVLVEETGSEWVVRDVIGIVPVIDGTYLDPETVPNARDGLPPDVSPAPEVLGGIGALYVRWTGVSNNDPVVYEVHLSITTGFTPDATTLATETNGTLVSLRALPDSTDLTVGTTYYVRLIARDLDGSAAASSEASGQLAQANTPDIAVNAITADRILANSITAEHLDVLELESTKIYSPSQTGWRMEIGDPSKPIQYWNGTESGFYLEHDPATNTASAYVSGRVEFGNSQLEQDFATFYRQETGFQTPALRQKRGANLTGTGTSASTSWSSATVKGNLLLAAVAADGTPADLTPTITAPSGWTEASTVTRGLMRMSLFYISNAAVRSGTETFTLSASSYRGMALFEYSGIAITSPLDQTATANGNGTTVSTGTTLTTTQADELWFAVGAANYNNDTSSIGAWTDGFSEVQDFIGFVGAASGWQARGAAAARNATTTGTASSSFSVGSTARDWVGIMATFKAADGTGDPNAPATTSARLYAKARDTGFVELHTIDELGRQTRLGSGWNLLDQGLIPAAGLNLTNIPDWYQDLHLTIKGYTVGDTGDNARDIRVAYNGDDAGTNYVYFSARRHSDGTLAHGHSDASARMSLGVLGRANSIAEITIAGYSRGTTAVVATAWGSFHSATTKGVSQSHGRWTNTAVVNTISATMVMDFGVDSTYELYGVGVKPTA